MTLQEQTFWEKIRQFRFDELQAGFTFSQRLARENGWTTRYTHRVIEEYKKFIFLCCISDTGVTPSDPVDQAWHLHLTYTRSYWVDLCRNTLEKELHHNPTKGGRSEARKFEDYYLHTHKLYKEKFGTEPPADIWQDHQTRFTDVRFQRVNMKRHWLITKPAFLSTKALLPAGIILFGLLFIQASFGTASFVFIACISVLALWIYKNRGKGGNDSGSGTSCSGVYGDGDYRQDNDGGSDSDSGCSAGSDSGCSGCSGGD